KPLTGLSLKRQPRKMFSETEPARLAQGFPREPLKRMGGLVSLPPANGLGLLVPLPWQGTDSRLCGALSPACGGKHADEITRIRLEVKGNTLVSDPALPRANGSLSAVPPLVNAPRVVIINHNQLT